LLNDLNSVEPIQGALPGRNRLFLGSFGAYINLILSATFPHPGKIFSCRWGRKQAEALYGLIHPEHWQA
jgi:hypothetical protein